MILIGLIGKVAGSKSLQGFSENENEGIKPIKPIKPINLIFFIFLIKNIKLIKE